MKRIVKIVFISLFICSLPLALVNSQEKKNEKRIKIIIEDKSGTKTVLDTLFMDNPMPDSIKLKDGNVIYIGKHGGKTLSMSHGKGRGEQMFVTVSSGDEGEKEIEKEITIIACDSTGIKKCCDKESKIIMKDGKHCISGKGGNVMFWSSDETGSKGKRIFYINEDEKGLKEGEKTFNIEVKTDDSGNEVEKTKYVLAKDGMVISIEGNDEAKVKDLVKDIESKLGVNKTGAVQKQEVKVETKKTVKK